jgi:hypothetical protein
MDTTTKRKPFLMTMIKKRATKMRMTIRRISIISACLTDYPLSLPVCLPTNPTVLFLPTTTISPISLGAKTPPSTTAQCSSVARLESAVPLLSPMKNGCDARSTRLS